MTRRLIVSIIAATFALAQTASAMGTLAQIFKNPMKFHNKQVSFKAPVFMANNPEDKEIEYMFGDDKQYISVDVKSDPHCKAGQMATVSGKFTYEKGNEAMILRVRPARITCK